jgi:polyribonucleotide nucleotidyltransferase
MGLIKEGEDYIVLTDIAGVEDHLGDMDFKVAGTERGITALQMDIKISGVTFDILRDALTQAHEARKFILAKMAAVIERPREALSQYAPRIEKVQIDPSQIGLLIGKGGETIRGLCEEYESQIDVNDDGQVLIYSANGELADALVERIRTMMKEVEVGDEYLGKVVKTTAFGAFIELSKGTDGLLHISNVSPGKRVETVEEALNKSPLPLEASAAGSASVALTTRRSPGSRSRSWSRSPRAATGTADRAVRARARPPVAMAAPAGPLDHATSKRRLARGPLCDPRAPSADIGLR